MRTLLKLSRKGKDLIEKSFSTLYEDVKDYEIDYEELKLSSLKNWES